MPLPDEKVIGSQGESIGTIQILELYPEYKFSEQADTVFHELCHAMWERSTKTKMREEGFAKIAGTRAFDELNESFAKAIGTGWFRPTCFPKVKSHKKWYDNAVIDSFAHGLASITSAYLNENRSIDTDFVENANRIFNQKCSSAYKEINNCHAIHLLIETATSEQLSTLSLKIRKLLPNIRQLSGSSLGDGSLLKTQNVSNESKHIVFISPGSIDNLDVLDASEKARLKRRSPGVNSIKRGSNIILFCVADNHPDQEKLAMEMFKQKFWPGF